MSRAPSVETQLRNVKSELAREEKRARQFASERDQYRIRATKAEQEVAEWKRRFDLLLERTPKEPTK